MTNQKPTYSSPNKVLSRCLLSLKTTSTLWCLNLSTAVYGGVKNYRMRLAIFNISSYCQQIPWKDKNQQEIDSIIYQRPLLLSDTIENTSMTMFLCTISTTFQDMTIFWICYRSSNQIKALFWIKQFLVWTNGIPRCYSSFRSIQESDCLLMISYESWTFGSNWTVGPEWNFQRGAPWF